MEYLTMALPFIRNRIGDRAEVWDRACNLIYLNDENMEKCHEENGN